MDKVKAFLKVFFSPEGRKAQAGAVTSIVGYLVTLGVFGQADGVSIEQAVSAGVATAANAYSIFQTLNIALNPAPAPTAQAVEAKPVQQV